MKKRILIVADDKTLLEEMRQKLEVETDLVSVSAVSSDAGIELAFQLKPHLIIFDGGLPGLSEHAVCRRLRRDWETSEIPLLVLVEAVGTRGETLAHALGADEYLLKSSVSEQLTQKIRTMLRHQREDGTRRVFDDGRLYIDFDAYVIRVNSREPKLTFKEFSLLKFLIQNEGQVFSRDKLLDVVWGYQRFGKTRTVDVHVRRIRKKLELATDEYIQTVTSVGYLFKPHNEHPTQLTAEPELRSI